MDKEKTTDSNQVAEKANSNLPQPIEAEKKSIISDEMLLGIYGEALQNIRSDRDEAATILNNVLEMVFNEGDTTTSSKELLGKVLEAKIGTSDRIAKIADLMTRVKMKQPDTFIPWTNASSTQDGGKLSDAHKKELLDEIDNMKKKKR